MSKHPYIGRPEWAFWREGVAEAGELDPVVEAPFRLARGDAVVTAGSCFAQNIARYLRSAEFNFLVTEAAPPFVSAPAALRLNYGVYSARYGNIYTPRQLLQLFQRAYGEFIPTDSVWAGRGGSHVDPFRPQIQPGGFNCPDELARDRVSHFAAVRQAFETMKVFVFTLGLTEAWQDRRDGAVFPLCPGVSGGQFDRSRHAFVNFDLETVVADLRAFLQRLRVINRAARVILTVSPVPLVATAEGRHVLVSTVASKSILRVACDVLERSGEAHYFPAYEIVASGFAGDCFGPDRRQVTEEGVARVMRVFARHFLKESPTAGVLRRARDLIAPRPRAPTQEQEHLHAVFRTMCDEEALALARLDQED